MMISMSSIFAQDQLQLNRVKVDKKTIHKKDLLKSNHIDLQSLRDGDNAIVNTTLLAEDFSKFTAGSEAEPDTERLDDPYTSVIDDAYFNTQGWAGLEVYQAGGCALIKFSEEYGETGMLITPLVNTSGSVTIKCRMKSANPDGDEVGYNIITEDIEPIDSNIGFLMDDEWTEVSWFTSYGAENTYVYFFSYEDELYIDDIEIIHHYMPAPTILPATNITDTSFTANWTAIEEVDEYYTFLYAEHTSKTDETYDLFNLDFSDIESEGTEENPEVPYDEYQISYKSWYAYLPVYFNGGFGLSGMYSIYNDYSYLTSPEFDLSADGGKFTMSLELKGNDGENVDVNVFNAETGTYEFVDGETVVIQGSDWQKYTFEFEGGYERTLIEIVYYGVTNLLIDNLIVSQNFKEGDMVAIPMLDAFVPENSLDIVIDKKFRNDNVFYKLYGIKYMYAYDPYYGDYYMTGGIVSEYTEPAPSPLNGMGINQLDVLSPAQAYFSNGKLVVSNPDNEVVSVYSLNGTCLYKSQTDDVINENFLKGVYVVKIGNKVAKVVND